MSNQKPNLTEIELKLEIWVVLEIELGQGGFQQSSIWVSLFEFARKLEVRNFKIRVHYGAFIMVGIE